MSEFQKKNNNQILKSQNLRPILQVPRVGSDGERYRSRQLSLQIPRFARLLLLL